MHILSIQLVYHEICIIVQERTEYRVPDRKKAPEFTRPGLVLMRLVARMTCCSTESEKFSSAVVAPLRLMQGWERE